jgi:hypothetical protein
MKKAVKHGEDAVISDLDAAEILQPGVGAFDFSTFPIASQLAFVLKAPVADVFAVGDNQLRFTLMKSLAQGVGIVAAVGNNPFEMGARPSSSSTRNLHRRERAFGQPALGQLRGRKLRSDRYAVAVDHHHALRTFPTAGFADCEAPFLAVTNVASRKASSLSSRRRWSNIDNSFRHALCHTPCSSQLRNRRQQVDPSGYCSGMSRQRAPVRRTQRMPSKHSRLQAQGRPRPSLRRVGSGNNGSKILHCSSLIDSSCFFKEAAQQLTCLRNKSLS